MNTPEDYSYVYILHNYRNSFII